VTEEQAGPEWKKESKKKKGCLGCSLPVAIILLIVLIGMLAVGFAAGPLGTELLGDINLPEWMKVGTPEVQLPAETVFSLFGFPIANSVIAAWVTMFVLVVISFIVTRRMKIIPGRLQAALEFLIGWVYDLCVSVAGEKNGRRFFPIVTTIFLFVGFNAWLALLPGFGSIEYHTLEGGVHLLRPANTDINMPLALACMTFFYVEFVGLKTLGTGYIKKFFNLSEIRKAFQSIGRGKIGDGMVGLFAGFMGLFAGFLEAIGELIRIISLTFRLFGNMTAGEILLLVAMFLVPWLFALPFYGLELLIGFIQALIFAGLTLIFATVAISPHEEEAH
jgi:F-type H+-transporting ATPase subunit a